MSGSFPNLPKFPGEEAARRERLLEALRTPPAPRDSFADRVRHAFPALLMVAGAAAALLIVLAVGVLVVLRGVESQWLMPLLLVTAFLTLPTVAITAAVAQRAKRRRDRG